jgi:mycothiol synthase
MQGLELRPYAGETVVAAIVAVENAEYEADAVPGRQSVDNALAHYRHTTEGFDPVRDVTLATVAGRVVGYGQRGWIDTNDGVHREYRLHGAVHPDWRRRGVGSALIEHGEAQLRDLAATHSTERTRVFGTWNGDTQRGALALLEGHGYQPVRWFFDMTRPNLDNVPVVELPEGLELRPIQPESIRQVWRATIEAFRDHWGGGDDSDEALQRYIDSPSHDPSLWLIAFDGDEAAGGVINGIEREENEALGLQRGWLHSVWTRRQWRRRGLASALVAKSLALLRERGMTSAVLGVDADNPTGALGLYERAGFEVSYKSTAWRKPFEV